jgi:hypothetical protein
MGVQHAQSQATFHTTPECVTLRETRFDDLPPVDVSAVLHEAGRQKQHGVNVTGTRLTESDLETTLPDLMAYIRAPAFRDRVHELIGFVPVSTLIFARAYETGDKINWHYDQNLTKGRKYTAILHVSVPECNTSHFQYRQPCTGAVATPTQTTGTLFVYPGNEVFHRVTEQEGGEKCTRFVVIFGFTETHKRTVKQTIVHTLDKIGKRFIDY